MFGGGSGYQGYKTNEKGHYQGPPKPYSGGGGSDIGDKILSAPQSYWNWVESDFNPGWQKPGPEMAQSRNAQGMPIGTLQGWALEGNGPSAAQDQLNAARAQNVASASSAAKSATGMNAGARQRMAAEGEAEANASAANASAQLRSQEQQQAMGMYLGALDAWRRGDIATYQAMAQAYGQQQGQMGEMERSRQQGRTLLGMAGFGAIGGAGGLF